MQHRWLDDAAIAAACGQETFRRGQTYARNGHVQQVTWSDAGQQLTARVRGNQPQPYHVLISCETRPDGRDVITGRCTCPMRTMCKHVAAAMLVGRECAPGSPPGSKAAPSTWRRAFRTITESGAARPQAPLGLQLTVQAPLTYERSGDDYPRYRLGARPVMRGRKGRWIQGKASWQALRYPHHEIDPVHQRLALTLLNLHPDTRSYAFSPQWLDLGRIHTAALWQVLQEARQADMPIVLDDASQAPVEVRSELVDVVFDISRGQAGLSAVPEVWCGDQPIPALNLGFIGRPSHGIFAWEQDDRSSKLASLQLMPLRAPLPDALVSLILAEDAIEVPAAEEPAFLLEAYPAIARRYCIISRDTSFAAPAPPAPSLQLQLRHEFGRRVSLEWFWAYLGSDGSGVGHLPLWSDDGLDYRDGPAELEQLQAIDWLVQAHPELASPDGRLAPGSVLTGRSMIDFLSRDVPELGDRAGVQVHIDGAATEYQALLEDPQIQVGLAQRPDSWDWFDLSVDVTVAGHEVPFEALFLALAAGEEILILDSGGYLALDSPRLQQLRALIEEARELRESARDGLGISRYHVDLWQDLVAMGVIDEQSAAWQQSIAHWVDAGSAGPRTVADGLIQAEPRHYQLEGFTWLASLRTHGLGGILADDMGLGKTLQAIMTMVEHQQPGRPPFLVVAPTSVTGNWARECERFAPSLRTVILAETSARRGIPLAELVGDADVVITSYAIFRLDFAAIADVPWAGLWLDEAQFVKNRQSQAYACARRLPTPFKVAITGTPLENNLMELWSLLSITAPGLFPNPDRFAEYYQRPIEREMDAERLAQLRRRIRPFMLRRTKHEVASELPPKQEQVIELDLHPRHHRIYQQRLQRERQKILGLLDDVQGNRFEIFRSLTMLRQLSLDASLVDDDYADVPSAKLDALIAMLDDLVAEGHQVLVFSQFTGFLAKARDRLDRAGTPYAYLDGRTRKRQAAIDAFTAGGVPVFLISLKAGGFGLNLTAADYVIILDPWWNPATEAQAVDRAHRIGQHNQVMVYRLVSRETIEERVMAMKAHKAALFDAVMTGTSAKGSSLTAEEIRELVG
ncbi:MAG: DEAD/DEAH box helicase [Actinomycetales bacterium]|nr:DEAD/DEAH box helicase [Actinomycetales bacterium]